MRRQSVWLSVALLGLILVATLWPSLAAQGSGGGTASLAAYPSPYPEPTSEYIVMMPVTLQKVARCEGSQQILLNSSFEEGFASWAVFNDPLITQDAYATGQTSVLMAGYNNARDELQQTAVVPDWAESGAIYISWLMQTIEPSGEYDALFVTVRDLTAGDVPVQVYVANNTPTEAWYWGTKSIPNVVARRGHSLRVEVLGWTDVSNPTAWFIDDVELVFACGTTLAEGDVWGEPLDYGLVPEGDVMR
ncbi:MAG: hypothetical protein ACYC4R_11150 [Anaerolineae bacterium]